MGGRSRVHPVCRTLVGRTDLWKAQALAGGWRWAGKPKAGELESSGIVYPSLMSLGFLIFKMD